MLFLLPAGASSDEQIPSEKRAHCKDVRAGPRSDMCRHEAGKELRVFRKDSCYALSQRGARIEFEQRLPHPVWPPDEPPVRRFVSAQIVSRKRVGKGRRLPERQAQPFSGDRVHATGRVSDQRHAPAAHARQPQHRGNSPLLRAGRLTLSEPGGEPGKRSQGVAKPQPWVP